MMSLTLRSFAVPQRAGKLALAMACFAAGLTAGTWLAPADSRGAVEPAPAPASSALRSGHPAEVLRVFDGDTFEARVRIWPNMDVTTRVRLRGVDAPEIHGKCEDERSKAATARDALTRMLAEGNVAISRIGQDKYGGRVDADVSTARTPDVGEALVARGLARRYDGGRRDGWCS
jgi:endonuclease YncB( thermonuclease family)